MYYKVFVEFAPEYGTVAPSTIMSNMLFVSGSLLFTFICYELNLAVLIEFDMLMLPEVILRTIMSYFFLMDVYHGTNGVLHERV